MATDGTVTSDTDFQIPYENLAKMPQNTTPSERKTKQSKRSKQITILILGVR
jgi:hypothetical protein